MENQNVREFFFEESNKFKQATHCGSFLKRIGVDPCVPENYNILHDRLKFYFVFEKIMPIILNASIRELTDILIETNAIWLIDSEHRDDSLKERLLLIKKIVLCRIEFVQFYKNGLNARASGLPFQRSVVDNFEFIFPNYVFVGEEVIVPGGRIDILAKCLDSNRDVIIECKLGHERAKSQLKRYAKNYKPNTCKSFAKKIGRAWCYKHYLQIIKKPGILPPGLNQNIP